MKIGERYGKLKNGKLILAPQLITRDGELLFDDKSLYETNDYKKLLYTIPPENKEGYDLVSGWEEQEDLIVQKWSYKNISDDYSGELLVAVKTFTWNVEKLKHELKENYKKNEQLEEDLFKKNKLIRLIYEHKEEKITTKQLLEKLNIIHLDLERFFNWIKMKQSLEKLNYIVTKDALIYVTNDPNDYNVQAFMPKKEPIIPSDKANDLRGKIITPMYFKHNLYRLCSFETCTTNYNKLMYNMTFIYLFTLFDELLLKFIRIICMHEKKWLINNGELSAGEILKCESTDEIHMMMVEKRINELSWEGYSDKLEFLRNRGIIIDNDHTKLFDQNITFLSIKRNVLVHNNGVWNQASKDLLKGTDYYQNIVVGKCVERTYGSFEEESSYIESAIKYLYNQLCDKFKFLFSYDFLKES